MDTGRVGARPVGVWALWPFKPCLLPPIQNAVDALLKPREGVGGHRWLPNAGRLCRTHHQWLGKHQLLGGLGPEEGELTWGWFGRSRPQLKAPHSPEPLDRIVGIMAGVPWGWLIGAGLSIDRSNCWLAPALLATTRMRMHLLTLVMHGPLPNPSHLSNQPTQSTTTHRTRRKDAAEKRPAVPQLPGRGQRLHPGGPRAPAGRPGEFLVQHASIMHGLFIHRWWMKQQCKRWHLVEGRGGALFCPLWFDERFSAHPRLLLMLIVIVIVVIPPRSRGSRGPRPRPAWRSDR